MRKKKTKYSQELDRDLQGSGDENGENIQAEIDAAAPLEEKIDYVEETAMEMHVIFLNHGAGREV